MNKIEAKWILLALAALTLAVVVALPSMALSVLFKDISGDLRLNLVQVGLVWGFGTLPALISSWLSGAIGDRFGPRRVMILACLLTGLSGAARGLSHSFPALLLSVGLMGFFVPFVSTSAFKATGIWFRSSQLGLANGVLSMGMALGFLGGSILSASVVSPWLGGWRSTLILYGLVGAAFCLPWLLARAAALRATLWRGTQGGGAAAVGPIGASIRHVADQKGIWLLALAILGVGGCVQGTLGYLPLYLRGLSWPGVQADSALGMFHTLSMILVVPVALLSDRPGLRKKLLIASGAMITAGIGLLAVAPGGWIWAAVGLAGMVRDGFMAIFMTSVVEVEGIGPRYAGTATGFVNVFSNLGSALAPAAGNSLAGLGAGVPFAFWALLALFGLGMIGLTRPAGAAANLVVACTEVDER